MLGLTISKTIEKTNCDLDVAVVWFVSAKNYLVNVNDFSRNQFEFEKKRFPNVSDDLLPDLKLSTDLENKQPAKQSLKIQMRYILLKNFY